MTARSVTRAASTEAIGAVTSFTTPKGLASSATVQK
jgi:hypothetical protein